MCVGTLPLLTVIRKAWKISLQIFSYECLDHNSNRLFCSLHCIILFSALIFPYFFCIHAHALGGRRQEVDVSLAFLWGGLTRVNVFSFVLYNLFPLLCYSLAVSVFLSPRSTESKQFFLLMHFLHLFARDWQGADLILGSNDNQAHWNHWLMLRCLERSSSESANSPFSKVQPVQHQCLSGLGQILVLTKLWWFPNIVSKPISVRSLNGQSVQLV